MGNIHWKLILIICLSAAFFFLLIGIISGNAFGVVLFRMFVSTIVTGLLVFGIDFLSQRYFPGKDDSKQAAMENESGEGNIDIVLDEENPHAFEKTEFVEELDNTENAEGDFIQEVEEVKEDYGVRDDRARPGPINDDLMAETLDELPSLDHFESTFSSSTDADILPESDIAEGPQTKKTASRTGPVDVMGFEHAPEEVARAVQTILKKDRKG